MKVFLYARVNDAGDPVKALQEQMEIMEYYCKEHGIVIAGVEMEQCSGERLGTKLESAMDRCMTGEADAIVVRDSSRLSGDITEVWRASKRLARHGKRILSCDGVLDAVNFS